MFYTGLCKTEGNLKIRTLSKKEGEIYREGKRLEWAILLSFDRSSMDQYFFVQPLKPGKLQKYKEFLASQMGNRKKEYIDMFKRYGLFNAKIWHKNIQGIDYIFVYHEAKENSADRLKEWTESKNSFDQWMKENMEDIFETTLERADILQDFDIRM